MMLFGAHDLVVNRKPLSGEGNGYLAAKGENQRPWNGLDFPLLL